MKNSILYLFLIFIVNNLYSQNENFIQVKLGNEKLNCWYKDVCNLKDNSYIVVTVEEIINNDHIKNRQYPIYKYDINGNLLWKKEVDKGIYIHRIIELEDGSLVFGGGIAGEYNSGFPVKIMAFKLNPCGEFEWGISMKNELMYMYFEVYHVIDIKDGLLLICDRRKNEIPAVVAEVIKLDYNGNLLWHKVLPLDDEKINSVHLLAATVDNNQDIILAGMAIVHNPFYPADVPVGTDGSTIIKIDKDGNLLWQLCSGNGFPIYGYYDNKSIITDNENNIYGIFHQPWMPTGNGEEVKSYCPLLKLAPNGSLIGYPEIIEEDAANPEYPKYTDEMAWVDNKERIFTSMSYLPKENEPQEKSRLINPITIKNNKDSHDFISKNHFGESNYGIKIITDEHKDKLNLLVIDKEANKIFKRELDICQGYVRGIKSVENNNTLVFTNNNFTTLPVTSYMMKYKSDLNDAELDHGEYHYDYLCGRPIESGHIDTAFNQLPLSTGELLDIYGKEVEIYPNPAKDYINVILTESEGAKHIYFYDMTGSLKKTVIVPDGFAQQKIELDGLPKGLYMIKITSENNPNPITRKLIVN